MSFIDILEPMIRLSVMYPATPGSQFNWGYYLGPHLDLARRLLNSRGLVRTEIDRGISGLPPGVPPPYHAVGHLFFRTMAELESALAATAQEFIADERHYSSNPSVVQISEVIE
ncbi:MAG: EthD family reductase [Acidobacteriota bacterium]|nr:EthD family reductase [Acidobacteriota bacterium]